MKKPRKGRNRPSRPRQKYHSCKIGTMPALVIFRHPYKPTPGKSMIVRDYHHGSKWYKVLVDAVNDDGYFFASL